MDLLEVLGLSPPADDNAVCFEIYKHPCADVASEPELDSLRGQCLQLIHSYLEGYIWQHDSFQLHSSLQQLPPWQAKRKGKRRNLRQHQGQQLPGQPQPQPPPSSQQQQQQQQPLVVPCLWGVVRYGDNVDDEWFVVWLLMELTRQLQGLCARAWDDDGEFLLIEAAYALPRWLKPETSTNRVWLHGGHLHVIPPPSRSAPTLPAAPSVQQALQIVTSPQVDTHQQRVEAAVLDRLSGYPGRARQQLQRVTAWLPGRVALLLQEDPQLVAAAVAAFMTRWAAGDMMAHFSISREEEGGGAAAASMQGEMAEWDMLLLGDLCL